MTTQNQVKGVFQTWRNGSYQCSALYLASVNGQDAVNQFIDNASGSFATTHYFENETDAIKEYNEIISDNI